MAIEWLDNSQKVEPRDRPARVTPEAADVRPVAVPPGNAALLDACPWPALTLDSRTLDVCHANAAALALYGLRATDLPGLRWADLQLGADASQPALPAPARSWPQRHRRRDGTPIDVELSCTAPASDATCTVWVRELAPLRRAALDHALLEAIIQVSTDAIVCTDSEGLIQTFSPGAERTFKLGAEAIIGRNIDRLLPKRLRHAHGEHRRTFGREAGEHTTMGQRLVKGLRADEQEIDLEATVMRLRAGDQQQLLAILRDVTQRMRADQERQASRAQLSELAGKLMLQERELVKRMAAAMHDHLGQTLATMRMVYDTLQMNESARASPEVARLNALLGELIRKAVQQVRQVLTELRPPLLEESGLAAALSNELHSRALVAPQVALSLDVPPQLATTRWPTAVEYALFMIAREAIENALRHAQAKHVSVRLRGSSLQLQLEVRDDGIGAIWDGQARPGHLGIAGMRERARSIGARLELGPIAPQGWRVALQWEPAP